MVFPELFYQYTVVHVLKADRVQELDEVLFEELVLFKELFFRSLSFKRCFVLELVFRNRLFRSWFFRSWWFRSSLFIFSGAWFWSRSGVTSLRSNNFCDSSFNG